MKNLLVLLFMATLFVGCTDKKQKEEATEETSTEVVTDSNSVKLEEVGTVSDTTAVETEVVEDESSDEPTQE